MKRLRVSREGRNLVFEDGTPFFWLGDTAWELFHKLSIKEADYYLRSRAGQGFTVIQAVLLSELDGLAKGNYYGKKPLKEMEVGYDPVQPLIDVNNSYWDTVDEIIKIAEKYNIYMAILPSWGDKWNLAHGVGPVIFNEQNAYLYGAFLGDRYKDFDNVVWVMGGDRELHTEEHFRIIRAMVNGIKDAGASQLMTLHPKGCTSSSRYFPKAEWLDFHMVQSSHGSRNYPNYQLIEADYWKDPMKPVLEAEARYEDIAVGFQTAQGYFDEHDVRQSAYWAIFSGSFGYTYGHNSVWAMIRSREINETFIMSWEKAMNRPGALQMQYMKKLIVDYQLQDRFPVNNLLQNNPGGANHCTACKGNGYIMIYIPNGVPIELVSTVTLKEYHWFNPRNGETLKESGNIGKLGKFVPPSAGRGQDWVLVLSIK